MKPLFLGATLLLAFNWAEAQQAPHTLEPVTVCDVLDNIHTLRGRNLAILGRLDCEWNPTDHHSCFLAETSCIRPLQQHGHIWPAKIWLNDIGKTAPHSRQKVSDAAIASKLEVLREAAPLRTHKEWVGQIKNGQMIWGWQDVPDEWAIVYGRVMLTPNWQPNPSCISDAGCQPYEQTPVSLSMDWRTLATFGAERMNDTGQPHSAQIGKSPRR